MTINGKVRRQKFITRTDIIKNRDCIFVFGDNMERKGHGGQAFAARGQPNTVGIPTKWRPAITADAYFSDSDFPHVKPAIDKAFADIEYWRERGFTIVIPEDGIGTGRASLAAKAPAIFGYIFDKLSILGEQP